MYRNEIGQIGAQWAQRLASKSTHEDIHGSLSIDQIDPDLANVDKTKQNSLSRELWNNTKVHKIAALLISQSSNYERVYPDLAPYDK
jgi:hypothetical protein